MRDLNNELEIDASAERVWHVLTDFASFLQWNPFIQRASGELTTGKRPEVHIQASGSHGVVARPMVLKAEPNRELRWLERSLFPGLLDVEHIFTIEPLDANRVRFTQREILRGITRPARRSPSEYGRPAWLSRDESGPQDPRGTNPTVRLNSGKSRSPRQGRAVLAPPREERAMPLFVWYDDTAKKLAGDRLREAIAAYIERFNRCATAPVEDYVNKRGLKCNTEERRCLCNGLLACVGLGQVTEWRGERQEQPA